MPLIPLTTLLTLIAVVMPITVSAAASSNAQLTTQRVLFRAVMVEARSGTLANDDPRLDKLRTYPLFKYIKAAELRNQLDAKPNKKLDKRIVAFIKNNPSLPPARRLRDPWLETLGERGRWKLILEYTKPTDDTADQCRAVHARIELDQSPKSDALALWGAGRSQPRSCNPVFAWLDKNHLLTTDEILNRARLSLLSGHYNMVRYLAEKLPDKVAEETEKWLNVAQSAAALRDVETLPDDILVYALQRYALRDWEDAADMYPALVKQLNPGAQARYEMQRYIALLYAQDQNANALTWFKKLDKKRMDAHTRGWEVRAALWQRQWSLVIDTIHDMPPAQANDEEWRYWLGRALLETGAKQKALSILDELATHRSYHGYLAADLLGQKYSFNLRPLPTHSQARSRVLSLPALARARELHAIGQTWRFRLEWNEVVDDLNQAELREAARIASQRGWYSRAIITLARSGYWDALDIRYPTPYLTAVEYSANKNTLSPAYVLAIIRTESLFQPAIVSSAGAIGLMQLMPATARQVARRNNIATPSRYSLRQPADNIRLGSHYLHSMKEEFDGNLALATAAYNAGPNAVKRWLPHENAVPPAIWIANISYTETREYVQRVMAHMTVFQHRLTDNVVPLKKRLAPIRPSYEDNQSDDRTAIKQLPEIDTAHT